MQRDYSLTPALFISLFALNQTALACASCGCTLNSDWENSGYYASEGFKLDLRYDYLNQDQLRSGTHRISSQNASQVVNDGEPQEVEKYTRNNYVTLSGDYTSKDGWGINIQVPYIHREHETLGTASDGITPGDGGEQYRSNTSDLGDIKLTGRYSVPHSNFGLLYGLKLPTGSHRKTGTSTDAGEPGPVDIDRGLQPGTGTTDGIIGAYYSNRPSKSFAYFVNGVYQSAFYSSDFYRPGNNLTLSAGARFMLNPVFTPQLQLNVRYARADKGANADTVSTGGTLVYLSPGLSVKLNKQASVYSFVQVPLYQDLNGVQLAPKVIGSVGFKYAF